MKNKEGRFISFLMASAGILVIGVLVLEYILVSLWKEKDMNKKEKLVDALQWATVFMMLLVISFIF